AGGDIKLKVQGDGKVGIGTNSPSATLHVLSATPIIRVGTSSSGSGAIELGNSGHGIKRSYSGANDVGVYTTAADLYLSANGTSTSQFVLKNSGNVGIRTASPAYDLDVAGTIRTRVLRVVSTSGDASMELDALATSDVGIFNFKAGGAHQGRMTYTHNATALNGSIDFRIGGVATGNIKLKVQGNGNVGVGTNSPSELLHVNGTAKVQNVKFDDFTFIGDLVTFSAYRSTNQSIASTTDVKLISDSEHYDYGNDYDVSTGVFTAPFNGIYTFHYQALFDVLPDQTVTQGKIVKNGNVVMSMVQEVTSSSFNHTIQGSKTLLLSTNDTIQVDLYHDNGSPVNILGTAIQTFFEGSLIRQVP
ncbi:complement C1q domain-containing protein, partial [bacterium]|nr:complement C1q domain-containing protein [bacterium]